ncbi:phage tail assembly protein [Ruminiclostridium herbifermentans]|uniref:Phage tail assembly protein n=1 Tax=Ruminiclostridium herbifermentans TaxID=2488810 RepID=A0A4U7JBB6_9FIRM|nr:phage tail assembly protein [Ruminiclostridium herbifermentans]QNU67264.1 phage tail assembly protein [Ruminiclostridium herbifermentans]
MGILKLNTPVKINGEEKQEIEYDLDALTGADIQNAVRELAKKQIVVSTMELDPNYHAALFAAAAGISFDDMANLKSKDYQKAVLISRDFFLESEE